MENIKDIDIVGAFNTDFGRTNSIYVQIPYRQIENFLWDFLEIFGGYHRIYGGCRAPVATL